MREIGGNCIRIEDKDRTLLFDQGIRFSRLSQYYSHRIEPKGIPELRRLGIIPPKETYRDVSAIYITHFHLDHLGLLANIPRRMIVKIPSPELFKVIERWYRMSPTWMAYIPPRYTTEIQKAIPLKADENNVMAIPVEHSIYPAYAYIYFGSDSTILYTGDLRITSILNPELHKELYPTTLLNFLEEHQDIRIDNLIIEGTNLGAPITPLN
ncbi:MBL fold metallo-hydrolase, partial [Candidatus Bathyarchaeota archaeon]